MQSKHLVNVFKEARSAYRERKAELKAVRDAEFEEQRARQALEQFTFDDKRSATSSRISKTKTVKSNKSHSSQRREAPHAIERGYTDSFYANDAIPCANPHRTPSSTPRSEATYRQQTQSRELVRRNTEGDLAPIARLEPIRSHSDSNIDMDLAYGELPPPLPARSRDEQQELRGKMTKLQSLLDEANCLQHSVSAMIANLEKNPDALAAVALTLAEISNLAGKMAPGALAAMKGSFPAVVALLASPEFMIAAGVGVGITIVALGGYKIIKKIKEKKVEREGEAEVERAIEVENGPVAVEAEEELQELEVDADVNRIELWRRGIADAEAESVLAESVAATSVDGELVTTLASKRLIEEGKLKPEDLKETKSEGKSSSTKRKKRRRHSHSKSSKEKSKPKSERKETSRLRHFF